MIHIQRNSEPSIFKSEKFLKEFETAKEFYSSSKEKRRQRRFEFKVYLNKEIREALVSNFHGKCAFCESVFTASSHGETELFRPKGGAMGTKELDPDHYWWLCYEWNNFYLSCEVCARTKKNFFPVDGHRAVLGAPYKEVLKEKSWLVDPCNEDPLEHLTFDERGFAISRSRKGEATIEIFGLNRPNLKSERRSVVRNIQQMVLVLEKELKAYQKIKKNKNVRPSKRRKTKIKR